MVAMDTEAVVLEEYSRRIGAVEVAPGPASQNLCSAEAYDRDLLSRIPAEIVKADFGCGNPSRHVRPGETVLDLGGGSGKICYLLSQVVGPEGRVIGVDMNKDMVTLARRHREEFALDVGYDNLTFLQGRVQDLRTDLELVDQLLSKAPAHDLPSYLEFESLLRQEATERPLVPDNSVDVVVSNCVINLVRTDAKEDVLHEMYRVLKPGGRIAISDNVSDIEMPGHLKNDPELWAKCYGGVFQEQAFYAGLEKAGFTGIRIDIRRNMPRKTIENVHFHSVTVIALKPQRAPEVSNAAGETVLYRGPWLEVKDEHGTKLRRGVLTPVNAETWQNYQHASYDTEIFRIDATENPQQTTKRSCCG